MVEKPEERIAILETEVKNLVEQVNVLRQQQSSTNEALNKWKGVVGFLVVCAAIGGFVLQLKSSLFGH